MSTLREEFTDRDYRHAYADSLANTTIATQIRLLRGSMTQAEFAKRVGMKQSRISAMEDENYSAWSTTTLKQIAERNDVVFLGRFVSFGELLQWSASMSEIGWRPVPFSQDPAFTQATRRTDNVESTEPAFAGGQTVAETLPVATVDVAARTSLGSQQAELFGMLRLVHSEKVA